MSELNLAKQKLTNLQSQKNDMRLNLMKLSYEIEEQKCLIVKLKKENEAKEKIYNTKEQIEYEHIEIAQTPRINVSKPKKIIKAKRNN